MQNKNERFIYDCYYTEVIKEVILYVTYCGNKKIQKMKDESLIHTNLRIDPDKSYILFAGNIRDSNTTIFLEKMLSQRYHKPVEIINILPNMPPPHMDGNFIVINRELAEHIATNSGNYYLPLDHPDINKEVSESPYIKDITNKILENQPDLFINLFKNSPKMTLPQKDERIMTISPSSGLCTYFDNKLNQRVIMEQLGIPVPKGQIVKSYDELINAYKENFRESAFVTCQNGSGGNGTEKISSLDEILSSEKIKGKKQFIISELLDLASSPSTLGIIANEDEVMVSSITDQIMDGVDYKGTLYPSSAGKENIRKMKEYTENIGKYLGSKGYKGFFGIDFMVDKDDNLYFTEINPRKMGSTPESILAYKTENPALPALSELEFNAVTRGTFNQDISEYQTPEIWWGVRIIKAKKGQKTTKYFPRSKTGKSIFQNSGDTILDHSGKDIEYLGEGRLARTVYAINNSDFHSDKRKAIISKIEQQKNMIESSLR